MREDTRTDTTSHSFSDTCRPPRPFTRCSSRANLSLSDQPLTTYSRLDFFFFFFQPPFFLFPGNAVGGLGWRGVLWLWVTERGRRGALCSALLCSALHGSARRRTQEDSRSPRCWKSERSLLSRALAWGTMNATHERWPNSDPARFRFLIQLLPWWISFLFFPSHRWMYAHTCVQQDWLPLLLAL